MFLPATATASIFVMLSMFLPANAAATYTLQSDFTAANWFSSFSVQSIPDPTAGFVTYVSQSEAQSSGIYRTTNNQIFVGVDNSTVLSPSGPGRNSVRLVSNAIYNHGLFIADFAHIPGGECGSWPAFWMLGPVWPTNGEIDIMEGMNAQTRNLMTLHTLPGCDVIVGKYGQTGTSGASSQCGAGCSVSGSSTAGYGTGFNNVGGGVFVLKWTSDSIKIWQFNRGRVPPDIAAGRPKPTAWGVPAASFAGCEFDNYFRNMSILFDVDFCGVWAGQEWPNSPTCSKLAQTCNIYTAETPHAYDQTYWLIDSLKVYSIS